MCIHIYIHICTCTSKYMCVYIYTHIFAISLKLSGFPTKTRNVAGECELFRMGPRERVQTLTQRTWGRRQASCRCVRRGRCRWVIRKMRVLETERTRLRHLRVATWVQLLWSQQHLLKDFVGVCGSRKMVRLNQRVGGASTKELFQRVVSWDRRSWGRIFMRQKVFLNEVSLLSVHGSHWSRHAITGSSFPFSQQSRQVVRVVQ